MTRRSVFQRDRKIQIPRACGTYILILRLERTRIIQVGKLGRFRFPLGWFAYVGSAFGPGGLRGRLKHHLNPSSRTHWHIDYLRNVADLNQVWIAKGENLREHTWAALLHQSMKGEVPVRGFGSSDCRCIAHLFRFEKHPSWESFRKLLPNRLRTESSVLKFDSGVDQGEESLAGSFLGHDQANRGVDLACRIGGLRKRSNLP